MRILAYNCGHDGSAVLVEDGRLVFSIESEKDNDFRYSVLTPTVLLRSLQLADVPDIIATSGWMKDWVYRRAVDEVPAAGANIEAGYFGTGPQSKTSESSLFAGRSVRRFSSSHERSHILCSYGLSPFPQGQPCYALVWEGELGAMYYVDEHVSIRKLGNVVTEPGNKYALLYALADPAVPVRACPWVRFEDAGKLMALAAFGRRGPPTSSQKALIERLLALENLYANPHKATLSDSEICDVGVESEDLKDIVWQFSEELFNRFHAFAKANVTQKLPLLIAGGCGLNCEWNSRWQQSGLFSDVFVPPCTNDSGVAIGAAIDALHHYTGRAKIEWSVYAGEPFVEDVAGAPDFECSPLGLSDVCRRLARGDVIAWVQGRYEIGPRALGNRSLLAEPFTYATRDKLNRVKQRECFRPIAPVCLEEDFGLHFAPGGPSPHMLYFQRVRSPRLQAVTHVDGSARAQSVNDSQNLQLCALLREFRDRTGAGVLCNTSLNFKGRGFVNRLSDLLALARQRGIDGIAVGSRFWAPRRAASAGYHTKTTQGCTEHEGQR